MRVLNKYLIENRNLKLDEGKTNELIHAVNTYILHFVVFLSYFYYFFKLNELYNEFYFQTWSIKFETLIEVLFTFQTFATAQIFVSRSNKLFS